MTRVLVVDDEWLACWQLCDLLDGLGATSIPASSLETALGAIDNESPDLAFVDAQLTGHSFEIILRECDAAGIRTVVCSAVPASHLPLVAQRRPYLGKPFGPDDVERAFTEVLSD